MDRLAHLMAHLVTDDRLQMQPESNSSSADAQVTILMQVGGFLIILGLESLF